MAGHSKFKNIMHKKGRADAARSKLFSKLSRDITVAAKSGMPDPAMNPRLRLAVNNAKAESLPKDVIQRAINGTALRRHAPVPVNARLVGIGARGVHLAVSSTLLPADDLLQHGHGQLESVPRRRRPPRHRSKGSAMSAPAPLPPR